MTLLAEEDTRPASNAALNRVTRSSVRTLHPASEASAVLMPNMPEARAAGKADTPSIRRQQRDHKLGLAWCGMCMLCVTYNCHFMEPNAVDLGIIYFQPLIPPLAMLWLWSHNVSRFEALKLPYDECFSPKDRKYLAPAADIRRLATTATVVFTTWACIFASACASRWYAIAEYVPFLLYCSFCVLLALPLDMLSRPTRSFFVVTAQRVIIPARPVSWADFLLADMFTSLAKSTSDMSRAVCFLATGPSMQQLVHASFKGTPGVCAPLAPLAMASVCTPYVIRFIQCLHVFSATRNVAQLFNAGKYASALPALLMTVMEHEAHISGHKFPAFWAWIGFTAFNSLFSYYWDIEQDWDMPWVIASVSAASGPVSGIPMTSNCQSGPSTIAPGRRLGGVLGRWLPGLRANAAFQVPWYVWACISNLVLRLSWTYRLVGNIEASAVAALAVAVFEVFRRYQWAFIRIETELRKLKLLPHPHTSDGCSTGAQNMPIEKPIADAGGAQVALHSVAHVHPNGLHGEHLHHLHHQHGHLQEQQSSGPNSSSRHDSDFGGPSAPVTCQKPNLLHAPDS
mmetsp:Transcript_1531/g.4104  ORF Transcript_1531/g.4104 Transcript_1531/m.4104 type:complete len:569 (-) Transcript_1531:161-1867(-)